MPPSDALSVESDSTEAPVLSPPRWRRAQLASVRPETLVANVRFEDAFAALTKARGWAEYERARNAFLAGLGQEAVSNVLIQLDAPQPPPVRDVLQEFLTRHMSLGHFASIASDRRRSRWVRVALIEVITSQRTPAESPFSELLVSALSGMSHDPDPMIAVAVAEGVARLGVRSEVATGVLRLLEEHPSLAVRSAAAEALEALS